MKKQININNLDWSKGHSFDLFYAPCLAAYAGYDTDYENMKPIAKEWHYTNKDNLLHACIGASVAIRLKYKRGYIVAVEHTMSAIVHTMRI